MKMYKAIRFIFVLACSGIFLFLLPTNSIKAQYQEFTFSGNDPESYQCFTLSGAFIKDGVSGVVYDGRYLCNCFTGDPTDPDEVDDPDLYTAAPQANGYCSGTPTVGDIRPGMPGNQAIQAVLRPPKLQQLEIWFVRILYVVWAIVAALSFFFLVALGYQYMLTRGDVTKITVIRQRILYYILGVALVFLAVPVLTTVFRLMGINDAVECYDVEMPGFQFFFAELCTDPRNQAAAICASISSGSHTIGEITGVTCTVNGETMQCPLSGYGYIRVECRGNYWVVTYTVI